MSAGCFCSLSGEAALHSQQGARWMLLLPLLPLEKEENKLVHAHGLHAYAQRQHQHVCMYDEVQYHINEYKIAYIDSTLQLDTT